MSDSEDFSDDEFLDDFEQIELDSSGSEGEASSSDSGSDSEEDEEEEEDEDEVPVPVVSKRPNVLNLQQHDFLTNNEKADVLAKRVGELANNSDPLVDIGDETDFLAIARMELYAGALPYTIVRKRGRINVHIPIQNLIIKS